MSSSVSKIELFNFRIEMFGMFYSSYQSIVKNRRNPSLSEAQKITVDTFDRSKELMLFYSSFLYSDLRSRHIYTNTLRGIVNVK